jgi:hypothetical protein
MFTLGQPFSSLQTQKSSNMLIRNTVGIGIIMRVVMKKIIYAPPFFARRRAWVPRIAPTMYLNGGVILSTLGQCS